MVGNSDCRRADFILKKQYATSRPTSWALRELDGHNLTSNVAVISKRSIGDSGGGGGSILADKISRESKKTHTVGFKKGPGMRKPDFPARKYYVEVYRGD